MGWGYNLAKDTVRAMNGTCIKGMSRRGQDSLYTLLLVVLRQGVNSLLHTLSCSLGTTKKFRVNIYDSSVCLIFCYFAF